MRSLLAVSFLCLASMASAASYTTYRVPVPSELAPFASFELRNSQVDRHGEHIVVSYDLPAELVGTQHAPIVLGGKVLPGGVTVLSGEFGEASCFDRSDKLECIVQYEDLEIDFASVENLINQRTSDPVERLKRLQVARIFGGEPIGVVEVLKDEPATYSSAPAQD